MLNVENSVKSALASTLRLNDISSIHLHQNLRKDLQLDSMGSLMFLMKLEECIDGFFVDPETLETKDLETVSSVVRYIQLQMNGKKENVH